MPATSSHRTFIAHAHCTGVLPADDRRGQLAREYTRHWWNSYGTREAAVQQATSRAMANLRNTGVTCAQWEVFEFHSRGAHGQSERRAAGTVTA